MGVLLASILVPIVVSGDSAGSNLGLGMMAGEAPAGRPLPAGAVLYYGPYSQDFEQPSYREFAEDYGLTLAGPKHVWHQYAPAPNDARDPRAVPPGDGRHHARGVATPRPAGR